MTSSPCDEFTGYRRGRYIRFDNFLTKPLSSYVNGIVRAKNCVIIAHIVFLLEMVVSQIL